jgi:hypothetical protein
MHVDINTFCASKKKKKTNRVRRKPKQWEKTFANHNPNGWLIPRVYKELLQCSAKTNNLIKRWEVDQRPRQFFREDQKWSEHI